MAFAMEPKAKGDEDKVFTALRRLQEEDPTIDLHRDPQTGDQIVAGLVAGARRGDRRADERRASAPRSTSSRRACPTPETIRGSAKAHGRHKKQTRRPRASSATATSRSSRCRAATGFEFVDEIKGGVIPTSFIPAVEKGVREAMPHGVVAGYPVKDVRVTLFDGQYHTVDSSEMAFKIAGSQAMKQALEQAEPGAARADHARDACRCPRSAVGDVIGDLNSRRGRPLGMEPVGGMTEIKAEVPMAEMLTYAPDLRSITGGQGEYTMEFERYEEVPGAPRAEGRGRGAGRVRRRARVADRRPTPARASAVAGR